MRRDGNSEMNQLEDKVNACTRSQTQKNAFTAMISWYGESKVILLIVWDIYLA